MLDEDPLIWKDMKEPNDNILALGETEIAIGMAQFWFFTIWNVLYEGCVYIHANVYWLNKQLQDNIVENKSTIVKSNASKEMK